MYMYILNEREGLPGLRTTCTYTYHVFTKDAYMYMYIHVQCHVHVPNEHEGLASSCCLVHIRLSLIELCIKTCSTFRLPFLKLS
jgi:hypothetical protein